MSQSTQIEMRKKKRHTRKNVMLAAVILALIISTSCTLYMNIDNPLLHNVFSGFGLDMATGNEVIDFEKTEKYAFSEFDGNAIVARSNEVLCVDDDMNTLWTVSKNTPFPVVKTNSEYALCYSFDSENVTLIKNGKATEFVTGNPVIGGNVNKNGYSAIITREKGYKAQVMVLSDEGELLYRWHSADNHIIDAVISPDNRTLAVATVDFSTDTASGGLTFFNFSQDKPYAGQILENNVIMQLVFTDKNSLLAVGDTSAAVFDVLGKKEHEYTYGGKKLTNFDVGTDGSLVLALSESDSVMTDTDIKILSRSLKEKGTYTAGGVVSCIDSVEGKTLLVSDRTLSVISARGNELKKLDVNKDIKKAVLFGNGEDVLIAAGSAAEIVSLNKQIR